MIQGATIEDDGSYWEGGGDAFHSSDGRWEVSYIGGPGIVRPWAVREFRDGEWNLVDYFITDGAAKRHAERH